MSHEDWMERASQGDGNALDSLCQSLQGLIYKQAVETAQSYHCWRTDECGNLTGYTREILSDLKSVGTLELIERIRAGGYERSQGVLITYLIPFSDGAMRRYLESNMGTMAIDRDSMTLVRKAQMLYYREDKSVQDIAEILEITPQEAQRYINYATHFFSTEDLEGGLEYLDPVMEDKLFCTPEAALVSKLRYQKLQNCFSALTKREQAILGGIYGVFGYEKVPVMELAIRNRMKESGVEKAKKAALRKLQEQLRKDDLYDLVQRARKQLRKCS